jgi:hypothetical protein
MNFKNAEEKDLKDLWELADALPKSGPKKDLLERLEADLTHLREIRIAEYQKRKALEKYSNEDLFKELNRRYGPKYMVLATPSFDGIAERAAQEMLENSKKFKGMRLEIPKL